MKKVLNEFVRFIVIFTKMMIKFYSYDMWNLYFKIRKNLINFHFFLKKTILHF